VIFNNGSSQTADFTWVNGGYYNANGYVKTIPGAGEIEDPETPDTPTTSGPYTAYFDNSTSNWPKVCAYVWDAGNGNKEMLGSWPGSAITFDSESGYYKVTVSETMTTPMIIFNNGSGTQTADLSWINNGCYNANGYIKTIMPEDSGIENIFPDDNSPIEYYNMQGIRVTKPQKGLYLKKQGSKITKILF
jgi:hypothetical protein